MPHGPAVERNTVREVQCRRGHPDDTPAILMVKKSAYPIWVNLPFTKVALYMS